MESTRPKASYPHNILPYFGSIL